MLNLKTLSHYFIVILFPLSLGYIPISLAQNNSDWVISHTYDNLCGGYYQQPLYPYPGITKEAEANLPFELSADSAQIYAEGLSRLEGNVNITQGNKRFQADNMLLLRKNEAIQKIEAHSNLILTQPDVRVEANSGFWDPQNNVFNLESIDYRYYPRQARGRAKKVMLSPSKIILYNGTYTTCAPCTNTWELSAQKLTLNKDSGRGQGCNMLFKIKDVPVFYWPYLDFPIDAKRHSGFLAPRASSTSNSGFELALPFYWNIAPNFDYMIIPRILSERGVDFQNQFRYLTPNSVGHIHFNFLPHDKTYPVEKLNRIKLDIQHEHRFFKNWKGNIDFNYVGDNNYFVDLEQDIDNASITKLLQQVALSYSSLHWDHVFQLEKYQILYPLDGPIYKDDYHREPQWAFHALYPQQAYGLTFELDGAFTHFTHHTNPIDGHPVTIGQRYQARPGISLPLETPYSYFKPRVQLDYLRDDLQLSEFDEAFHKPSHLSRIIPLIDINTGLVFEKPYRYGYWQTIEPKLYYLYVPYVNQNDYPNFDSGNIDFSFEQQFRDNRFSGRDRVGDTNQITTALTSRFYNAYNEELIRLNIGEIFYFADRKTTLYPTHFLPKSLRRTHSDLVINLDIYPNKNWSFSSGIEWDPQTTDTNKAFVSFQYLPGIGKVINLDYYWMKCDPGQPLTLAGTHHALEQIDASFTWPLYRKLSLLGQAHYDFQENRMVTMLGGLEYQSCCLAYQLVGSRYLKPNNGLVEPVYEHGIFFQIMFKGLTTLSFSGADRHLATAIPGYVPFAKKIRGQEGMQNNRLKHGTI